MDDMGSMDGMGDMDMDSVGGLSLAYTQQMFWAVVGAAIGCAAVANLINIFMCRQR